MKDKDNLKRILKICWFVLLVLVIVNCVIKMNSSYGLFTKTVDSDNLGWNTTHTKPESGSGAEYIQNLAGKYNRHCTTDAIGSSGLAYDCTKDNNLRYIGANPNNYVKFNNELWRIIGVMNDIEDSEDNIHSQLKIILITDLAKPFDTNNVNDYSTSSIKEYLNNEYLNNISENSKEMIDNVIYNLGCAEFNLSASQSYIDERSTIVPDGHATIWIGKIGLMYTSDFKFSSLGGNTTNRKSCLNYISHETSDCYNSNYIFTSKYIYNITPSCRRPQLITGINPIGDVYIGESDGTYSFWYQYPVLYLKPSVKITGGSGTSNDPYTLSL